MTQYRGRRDRERCGTDAGSFGEAGGKRQEIHCEVISVFIHPRQRWGSASVSQGSKCCFRMLQWWQVSLRKALILSLTVYFSRRRVIFSKILLFKKKASWALSAGQFIWLNVHVWGTILCVISLTPDVFCCTVNVMLGSWGKLGLKGSDAMSCT